ncbi:MAG: tetratricopeptide repeat protein [Blastocatellia bacterium]
MIHGFAASADWPPTGSLILWAWLVARAIHLARNSIRRAPKDRCSGHIFLLKPDFAEAHNARGSARQRTGDFDGALADYNQAIKLDPRCAAAWFNRGMLWKAKGDWRRAEADFTQAIELKPHLADAYAQRGLARLRQGAEAEAEKDFKQCLEIAPHLEETLKQLILAARAAGQKP